MQTASGLLLLLSLLLGTVAMAQDRNSDEALVRSLDDQERIAALNRDGPALEKLWSDHDLIVRRIEDELFGPQSLQSGNIALQSGNAFLVVERTHELLIRLAILCHGDRPS